MEEWRKRAECRGMDVDLFFSEELEDVKKALTVCMACPVRRECADWGIRHEGYGVWGGLTQANRKRMRNSRPPAAPENAVNRAPCGTAAGYAAHGRKSMRERGVWEVTCRRCLDAHSATHWRIGQ